MNLLRKDMEEQAFFLEIQRLSEELEKIIQKHGMQDKVASIMVTGLIDQDILGQQRLQALFSYSLDSREELDSILEFINNTWDDTNKNNKGYDDIDDLLDGTGIDLE
tara:strand:- start:267 stop:587 length:321 start_codon:yes stop_codon:yes gene_type:complete